MKLTLAASYALNAIAYLATQRGNSPMASHTIAAARGIPKRFLLKILKHLVSAGLLHSNKGPRGGYTLARPASQISMLEVVEAIEGPIHGEAPRLPLLERDETQMTAKLGSVCQEAAEQASKVFARVRMSQLVSQLRVEPRDGSKSEAETA